MRSSISGNFVLRGDDIQDPRLTVLQLGQRYDDIGAAAPAMGRLNTAAMTFYRPPHDGQAQTGAG
jgi:hypothetical protein